MICWRGLGRSLLRRSSSCSKTRRNDGSSVMSLPDTLFLCGGVPSNQFELPK
jgi:hypothetical protein